MSRQEVHDLILCPMMRLFRQPPGITDMDGFLEHYYEALEPFPPSALTHAWKRVASERVYPEWPKPGEIVRAARTAEPEPDPRMEKSLEMAGEYTANYMKRRKVARVAREEGWASQLQRYVRASAWVQAQAIQGMDGIAWDSGVLGDRDVLARILSRKCVQDGKIDVTVPEDRQQEWRERVTCASRFCDLSAKR